MSDRATPSRAEQDRGDRREGRTDPGQSCVQGPGPQGAWGVPDRSGEASVAGGSGADTGHLEAVGAGPQGPGCQAAGAGFILSANTSHVPGAPGCNLGPPCKHQSPGPQPTPFPEIKVPLRFTAVIFHQHVLCLITLPASSAACSLHLTFSCRPEGLDLCSIHSRDQAFEEGRGPGLSQPPAPSCKRPMWSPPPVTRASRHSVQGSRWSTWTPWLG